MSIGADDELLQDFLVEAGEILDGLSGQLLNLENNPADKDLLNAIFRGFHTIKGGAGFLGLNALVTVCHHAEDVFNQLRQGEREVDAALMDVILAVVDTLNEMFTTLRAGQEPEPAEEDLITRLANLVSEGSNKTEKPSSSELSSQSDPTDAEFDALLDASQSAHGDGSASKNQTAAADEITEDEFDALLDEIHGKNNPEASSQAKADIASNTSNSEEITEDEFEALLDQMHGPGSAPLGRTEQKTAHSEVGGVDQQTKSLAPEKPEPNTTRKPVEKDPQASVAVPAAEATVRVDVQRLDDIMNLVGELVLVRNRLVTLSADTHEEAISSTIANLELVTTDLQNAVMRTRMQPIRKVFGRFPRMVRDLARGMSKEVTLERQGEETELDKNMVEALADPLVHLVRNAVDHGIEMPDVRTAAGKAASGHVVLAAAQQGDHILVTIEDDGRGMDPDMMRAKAVEKGLMDEATAKRLTSTEAFELIFQPGFSTKEQVSDISGRGVGMDVVKTRIAELNGTIEIDSELGRGSIIRISLPLTLAIVPTLMVKVGNRPFAIPLSAIDEILDLNLNDTKQVDNREVVVVHDKALPLVRLGYWLFAGESLNTRNGMGHVVVVHIGNKRFGYVVDELIGQEEVVIKPLGPGLRHVPGYAGATITGDGHLALILDLPGIMRAHETAA